MDTSTNQSGANWLLSCTFIERFKFCTKIKLYMMCGASVSSIDSFTVFVPADATDVDSIDGFDKSSGRGILVNVVVRRGEW